MANVKVKVTITNNQKKVKIPTGMRLLVRKCCQATIRNEGFASDAEISTSFVDNVEIRRLNHEYRNLDRVTDVLSFPLGENGKYDINHETGACLLGDVVISLEKAVSQAREYNHMLEREVAFLVVHSVLHLLGYDHVGGGIKALRMREREESILAKLGITRDMGFVENDEY